MKKWNLGTTLETSVDFYLFSNKECKISWIYIREEKSFHCKVKCEARNEYAYPYFTWM